MFSIARVAISLILCFAVTTSGVAQTVLSNEASDSTGVNIADNPKSPEHFNAKQLILPGALIAVGAFGVENGWFRKHINQEIRNGIQGYTNGKKCHIDNYIQYLPVASYVVMGSLGVKSRSSFTERILAGASAYIIMTAVVNTTKFIVDEPRPDSGAKNSFPSGHSATVFTGAELVRIEYGTIPGIAAYAAAGTVAYLRLHNDRHWFNDLLAGAGIGILSARAGYWLLPLERKLFHVKSKSSATAIALPFYDTFHRTPGLALSVNF